MSQDTEDKRVAKDYEWTLTNTTSFQRHKLKLSCPV